MASSKKRQQQYGNTVSDEAALRALVGRPLVPFFDEAGDENVQQQLRQYERKPPATLA